MNTVALSAILARANACPPIHFRNQFFDVKKHVLDRFGTKTDVIHWQTIEKRCWGEWYQGGCHADCQKCGGTGWYLRKTVSLEVWKFGRFTFHRPLRSIPWSEWEAMNRNPDIVGVKQYRSIRYAKMCCGALFVLFCPWLMKWDLFADHRKDATKILRLVGTVGLPSKSLWLTEPIDSNQIPF